MRYLYDCDTWKWGILPKIPWFKASFSLYIGIAIWWLHIIFRHPYTSIYIFWYSMIQPSKLLGIPTLDPFPITWKWRHSRQWSLGFIWPRPDQSKMRLKETNAVRSDVGSLDWSVDGRLHPESLQWGWIWFKGNLQEPGTALIWFQQATLLCWFSLKPIEMRIAWHQAVDTAQMSLELPPHSDDNGSGSLYSKDFVPRRLEKVTFPQKRHFSSTETDHFAFSSKNLRSRFVLLVPMGTLSRNVIRRWFVWFVCSVWARVTWFTHTCISENRAPYPNCSVSRVADICLANSLQILERPGLILHNIVWFYRVISLWLWVAFFCVYRIICVYFSLPMLQWWSLSP